MNNRLWEKSVLSLLSDCARTANIMPYVIVGHITLNVSVRLQSQWLNIPESANHIDLPTVNDAFGQAMDLVRLGVPMPGHVVQHTGSRRLNGIAVIAGNINTEIKNLLAVLSLFAEWGMAVHHFGQSYSSAEECKFSLGAAKGEKIIKVVSPDSEDFYLPIYDHAGRILFYRKAYIPHIDVQPTKYWCLVDRDPDAAYMLLHELSKELGQNVNDNTIMIPCTDDTRVGIKVVSDWENIK